MGRFFKTTDTDYSIDYMFDPNYKEITPLIEKIHNDNENNLKTLTLFNSLNVDHVSEWDKDRAKELTDEYSGYVNDLVEKIRKNPNDSALLSNGIRAIQSIYNRDSINGRIKALSDNKKAYDLQKAKIETLKDPTSKKIAENILLNYAKNNPYGAYQSIFKPEEVYEYTNIMEEYLASEQFKALKEDENAYGMDVINGSWVDQKTGSVKELSMDKLYKSFNNFLQSKKAYGEYMQKFNNEIWFDKNGNFDYSNINSQPYRYFTSLPAYAHRSTTEELRKKENGVWMQLNQQAFQARENALNRALERGSRSKGGKGSEDEEYDIGGTGDVFLNSNGFKDFLYRNSNLKNKKQSELTDDDYSHIYQDLLRKRPDSIEAFKKQQGNAFTANIEKYGLKEKDLTKILQKSTNGFGTHTGLIRLNKPETFDSFKKYMYKKEYVTNFDNPKFSIGQFEANGPIYIKATFESDNGAFYMPYSSLYIK